ncbi:MAG: CPBP family intramembrane glutamic endopeptidase [Promethearchaeota archaeon]
MSEIIESDNLILFFIVSFVFSWLLWLPNLLSSIEVLEYIPIFGLLRLIGTFGPFIAAFSLTYFRQGKDGVKILWKRGWKCENTTFLLLSFLLLPLLYGFAFYLSVLSEGISFTWYYTRDKLAYFFAEFVFIFFMGGPFQEEFGWRGYALDRLQSKWNALESSMTLGGIWGFWHLPLFFINETPQKGQPFFSYLFFTIILSIFFTWLYNNSNRSILVAMIFHTTNNISISLFPLNMTSKGNFFLQIC